MFTNPGDRAGRKVLSYPYISLQDQKTQNTQAGTFTSGAWRTRTLNTVVADLNNLCTLSSNQFILVPGTYLIEASAPAYYVNRHQIRIQNVTDNIMLVPGQGAYAFRDAGGDACETLSLLSGIFTVLANKALELQHQCGTTNNTNGFGIANNFTTEVYAMVELLKIL